MIFEQIAQLPAHILADFQAIMHTATYPKGHLLHKENQICNHLYIIQKGIARSFYHKDGKDITAHFALESGTITAIDSFIQRKRSRYNIEVLEEAEIIAIAHKDLQALIEKNPTYEKFIRLYLEQIYIDLAERIEDLLFHTAKERYDKLTSENPSLLQRVNLQHIASFIGVTQETLSRVRGKV